MKTCVVLNFESPERSLFTCNPTAGTSFASFVFSLVSPASEKVLYGTGMDDHWLR